MFFYFTTVFNQYLFLFSSQMALGRRRTHLGDAGGEGETENADFFKVEIRSLCFEIRPWHFLKV